MHNLIPAILTGGSALMHGCTFTPEQKPNIVILLADDMGWGDIRSNGNRYAYTPVLDNLRSRSLSFERFYVCPLSAPTRAEMLTGRYFLRTGVSSVTNGYENMHTDEVTLAEILNDEGYKTGCFGKWHNGRYYPQHPCRQGFDEYVGFPVGHLGYYYDAFFLHNDEEKRSSGYTSDYFTGKALKFIERNKAERFFCYVPYNVPHSPFQVPEEYFSKYNSMGLDSTLSSVYGMVENMDHNIGMILRKLDDLKIADNTIVIFLSDNGPNTDRYNGGMKGRKGSVDEGGVRTPFFIRWPAGLEPGKTGQLAGATDILPTLLGLCGIHYNSAKPLDGMDLSDIMHGKIPVTDRLIFSRQGNQVLGNCNSSVRNNNYRLVLTKKDTLLFDMQNDPSQKKNIYNSTRNEGNKLLAALVHHNTELVTAYEPATTIKAGFIEEKSFTLPVQDAILSGSVKYSSIHPNQSHTENWTTEKDSIFWRLDMKTGGRYKVEMQYGCEADLVGSRFRLISGPEALSFILDEPFSSEILPDRDYVPRTESVELTWDWFDAGEIRLESGSVNVILRLDHVHKIEAGLVKALRFTRI